MPNLSLLIAVCCLRQAPRSRQVGGLVLLLPDQVGGLVLLVALPLEHKQHPLLPGAALPPTQGLEYLLAAQILSLPLSSIPASGQIPYIPLFLNPISPIWRKVILTNQVQSKHGRSQYQSPTPQSPRSPCCTLHINWGMPTTSLPVLNIFPVLTKKKSPQRFPSPPPLLGCHPRATLSTSLESNTER